MAKKPNEPTKEDLAVEALTNLIYACKHGDKQDREHAVADGERVVGEVLGEPARSAAALAEAEAKAKADRTAETAAESEG